MDATEIFSKITYLEEGMKTLLAQKAASSEEIQLLLAAIEAKAKPTINFKTEVIAERLAIKMAATMPALDAAAVARQLGPLLLEGLPTPATLRQAGDEAAAKLNREFSQQEERMQAWIVKLGRWLTTIEQRVEKLVDDIPRTVGLDAFYDPKVFLLFLLLPILGIFGIMVHSLTTRVSKEQYEHLQEKSTVLQEQSDRMTDAGIFYSNQIKEYKRKFPKQAVHFRDYRPAPPAQPVALTAQ